MSAASEGRPAQHPWVSGHDTQAGQTHRAKLRVTLGFCFCCALIMENVLG